MEDVFALINQFVNMQLAYRHDERPGESYEALDGKKARRVAFDRYFRPTEKKDSGSWVFEPWWMNMHMSAHNAAHGFTKHKNTLMTQAW